MPEASHPGLAGVHCDICRGAQTEVAHQKGGLSEGALPAHSKQKLPAAPVHQDGGLHLGVQEAVEEADHQALHQNINCISRLYDYLGVVGKTQQEISQPTRTRHKYLSTHANQSSLTFQSLARSNFRN